MLEAEAATLRTADLRQEEDMGRSSWAIILACVLGAIFFGMLQRGCGLEADSPVVLVAPEPTDTTRVAPSPRATTRFQSPPPRPTVRETGNPRGSAARDALTGGRPVTPRLDTSGQDAMARADALRRARD